jgi:hypothetical protein
VTPEVRELLAHCADALGMDVDDEAGPYEAVALGENILEAIGFVDEVVDTDSRTVIADRLLEALRPTPSPTQTTPRRRSRRRLGWPTTARAPTWLRR